MKNKYSEIFGLLFILFLLWGNYLGVVHGDVKHKDKDGVQSMQIDGVTKAKVEDDYGKLPLYFIHNDGQINEKVRYYEKGNGHAMFFTERGVYLSLISGRASVPLINNQLTVSSKQSESGHNDSDANCKVQNSKSEIQNQQSTLVKLFPLGANKNPEVSAEGLQDCRVNYFVGSDPKKWKTNIPTYQAVVYKDIYKDIDMKFYGNNRQLEYDIIVKPSANPSRVQLSYQGIEGLQVTEDGDLEISLKEGKVIQKKPYVYQEIDGKKIEIDGKFKIYNAGSKKQVSERITQNSKSKTCCLSLPTRHASRFVYGFQVASYDKHYPLIIDPVLDYSTFIGGSENDRGFDIAVDASGNAYVTGSTYSSDFPAVSAFDGSYAGGKGWHPAHMNYVRYSDAFVTKINASGSSLVYATYLGGSNIDSGFGIAVDTSENAYITGQTWSSDFPTANAMYGTNTGQFDAFVTKLASTGSSLIYSTYLGGSRTDGGNDIAVDTSGNVYVAGVATRNYSDSPNFPVSNTAYPHYGTYGGGTTTQDAFVTKINASGSNFVYSILIGGAGHDRADGIAIDTSGNAYITGQTRSSDFPMFSAIYGSLGGTSDAFVAKINNSGSIVYSTFLGGTGFDQGSKIAVDNSGNAYVTGRTDSSDFPTANAIHGTNTGQFNSFVTKLNATGNSLAYSTYILNGIAIEGAISIAVDTFGNAYVLGYTLLPNPTIFGIKGNNDVYVTKLNASGNNSVYSVCLGGSSNDFSFGIAVDNFGSVYITGSTTSSDFPTTSDAYDTSHNGNGTDAYAGMFGGDVFVTKIKSDTTSPTASSTNPENGATNVAVDSVITAVFSETMDASTITTDTFKVSDSNGNIDGTVTYSETTATFTPSSNLAYSTTYTVTITTGVKDASGNTISSDYSWNFTTESAPNSAPVANAGTDQSVQEESLVTLDGSGSSDHDGDSLTYTWIQIAGTPVILDTSDPVLPTFTAPNVPRGGETLTFQLTVSDSNTSNTDEVNITIKDVNHPPVTDAGSDQTVQEGSTVTLDGSNSYDSDSDILTYSWVQTAGTEVTFSDSSVAQPTFNAPLVGQAGDILTFELTVSDGLDSTTDMVNVIVENINHSPIANAGEDQTKDEGSLVTLDGTKSSDPDNDTLTFTWSQISGTGVTLSDTRNSTPTFEAPAVTPGGETLVFQLIVNDGVSDGEPDEVTITILDVNDPPACDLAQANPELIWPPNHKLVEIEITGVTDPNDNQVTITITGVTQDEPVNGLGDGDTSPDAVIQGNKVLIRAERSGKGNGRVYQVTFTADDGEGGQCSGTVKVCVPHDRKTDDCVDDSQNYNSLQE